MKIFVTAKTRAKQPRVELVDQTHVIIFVKELPTEGKANRAITKALARHLGIAQSRLKLVSGFSSKSKIFELA